INGARGETAQLEDMERRIRYDLEYLRQWSLRLDLYIIWRTIRLVFKDPQAYQRRRVQGAPHRPAGPYSACLISRPASGCSGRTFIGWTRAKIATCDGGMGTGSRMTIHTTPSVQGGDESAPTKL